MEDASEPSAVTDYARANERTARSLALLPIAVIAALVARAAIGRVYEKVGHAAAALDDAYIHFQYARAIAEGHPMRFSAGDPTTSGATSVLWPALLALPYKLGLHDDGLVWAAWVMSFFAYGALAYEAFVLTRKLAGEAAAASAAMMTLAFPAFAWCAASGMEVMPLAWVLARTARRASEWAEGERTPRDRGELLALAWFAALLRPEGALAAAMVTAVLAIRPAEKTWRARTWALGAVAAIFATPLFLRVTTGSAVATTATVKLLPYMPYYQGRALAAAIAANARILVGELWNGEKHSLEFLPSGGAWLVTMGLVATGIVGWRSRTRWRAGFVLAIALSMFLTCAYYTFLWNRLRYLWPFAFGYIIGIACLARLCGDVAAIARSRWRLITPLACGACAGMLMMRLDWTLEDVAQSASGIDRQQVALGRWIKDHLPAGARVGVNDTGAIAYFGEHPTFDVVGLTTRDEGKYWVAGAGSRLEHYERLHATAPERLPAYFCVYRDWMACDAVLGAKLMDATVTDATILGGATMSVFEAKYDLLGSGESPWTKVEGEHAALVDSLDVADLESEASHGYDLLRATEGEQIAAMAQSPDGRTIVDGGRTTRARERFVAHLHDGAASHVIARISSFEGTTIHARAGQAALGDVVVPPGEWTEVAFDVPPEAAKAQTAIEIVADAPIAAFHYWFF